MVSIREARPADAAAVRAVHGAAIRAFGPRAYTEREVEAWSHVGDPPPEYPIDEPDAHFVVAEAEGRVVGFGDLDREDGEVRAVYVHPDRARQGVGTALLAELEGVAREEGHDELFLLASLNAVGFYERNGYERRETGTHETQGGVDLAVELMRKGLDG